MTATASGFATAARGGAALLALAFIAPLAGCGNPAGATSLAGPAILFSPIASTSVYLMDLDGQKLHEWTTAYAPGYSVYLLPTGHLLRATSLPERPFATAQGSNGGRVEMLDWNSNPVWRFDYATTQGQQHHDVYWMPTNGHVLMVAWEAHSAAEAIAAGRAADTLPSEDLWVDKIAEVDPGNNQIVWEWRIWDHLVPPGASAADYPGRIDPRFRATRNVDWTHANAVTYNAELDQVLLSVRNFSELWVIDHSTTTAEAAGHTGGRLGHGGDIVYRWGNPLAYRSDGVQQLFGQHNPSWIPDGLPGAGHILVFNNGDVNARPYSTVVELEPPLQADGSYGLLPDGEYGPASPLSQYSADPPSSLFASIISGAQRLPSGNTLVTDGPAGRFLEVTPAGQTVWSYVVADTMGKTGYQVFRAVRYEPDFPGLAGQTLVPQGPLQITVP